jgi:hypothetical protein
MAEYGMKPVMLETATENQAASETALPGVKRVFALNNTATCQITLN